MTLQIPIRRREFLSLAGIAAAGLFHPGAVFGEVGDRRKKPSEWTIGCFNRPWGRWTYDEALDAMRAAGFRVTGLLGNHAGEPFILPEATPAYLARLKERIAQRELTLNMAWMRTAHDVPVQESVESAHAQVENAAALGVRFLMTTGVNKPEQFDHFYRVMEAAAGYALERKMQIVIKPHGGVSAAAAELLRCIERVGRPNFRVCYDAGNIIHYTGTDPVADVDAVARYVTGFCAKDCPGRGGKVMIQFGDGKVDFRGVFGKLAAADFDGPVMVECCAGETLQDVTANARRNREFLVRLFARFALR